MYFHHKNKTIATLLAALTGVVGLHRFYLRGMHDRWGWLHVAAAGLGLGLLRAGISEQAFFCLMPTILSMLAGILQALVLGVMPDHIWDQRFNRGDAHASRSGWPLALTLVLTLGIGATVLIATIARTFDLLFTGGAFG